MVRLNMPGFPEQVGEYIDFPNDGELLQYPYFNWALAEEVREHGTEFQKSLLDRAPLRNNKKYVYVVNSFRYLYPGIFANLPEFGPRNEWHTDGLLADNFVHIIMSDVSCRTEFNTTPFTLEVPEEELNNGYTWFLKEGMEKDKEWGLSPRQVDGQRFVTFTNHVHRASIPSKYEFRFFFRVIETDSDARLRSRGPSPVTYNSGVYQNVEPKHLPSISHMPNGFMIHCNNKLNSGGIVRLN